MPIFEFRCSVCGERFEILQSRQDPEAPDCPTCGSAGSERLLSSFALAKGSRDVPRTGPCGSSDCACQRREHTS